jgi:O-acetyl-ADP-ribose deacetylase (regulator of RNase III)
MTKISLFHGDITKLVVDAIVNATDEDLSGGGGVDLSIHLAAGDDLKSELDKTKICKTGDAIITKGYNLPSKYIIHTVGPIFSNSEEDPILLAKCYINSLKLCRSNNVRTIAFPSISTGVFGYPKDEASLVALKTVRDYIKTFPDDLSEIIFVAFSEEDYQQYKKLLK